jgi:hypothetical protein
MKNLAESNGGTWQPLVREEMESMIAAAASAAAAASSTVPAAATAGR